MADEMDDVVPGEPTCLKHYSKTRELALRVTGIEKKMETIDTLKDSVHKIEIHIAKQNGTLPRIEAAVCDLTSRLTRDEKAGAVAEARSNASDKVRDRVTWGLMSAIFITLLGMVVKTFLT